MNFLETFYMEENVGMRTKGKGGKENSNLGHIFGKFLY